MKQIILLLSFFVCVQGPSLYAGGCDDNSSCKNANQKREDAVSAVLGFSAAGMTALGVSIWLTTRHKDEKNAYFQENNKSIRKALSLGHGDALEDILKFYNVSPSQREGAIHALKDHRVELLDRLRPGELTPEQTKSADLYIRAVVFHGK